jgi:anaerobic magnesium-protoporphyrin IX monomethyl ester cyclase
MTNKRICLITPPSPFLLDERVFVNLGILRVAAVLEQEGYKIDFLDLSGIKNYLDVLDNYLESAGASKIFGITATTPQIPNAVKLCKIIKNKEKDSKVILGGPHVTLMNAASRRERKRGLEIGNRATFDVDSLSSVFDVLVCGDGEKAIFEALKIDNGIIDADDKKSPLFLTDEDFSSLPMPARHLVDINSYEYYIEDVRAVSLIAQLGCPFKCTFCSGRNSPFLRKIRTRSIGSIIEEIDFLYKTHDFKGFMFYDDELNVNKGMIDLMQQLRDYQEKNEVEFRLRGFIKAELFNDAQASAMYEAGFRWILTGFESGDEKILKNIRKIATIDDNSRCVEIAKRNNLKVKALMSIGHAGESQKTVENTKNWLLKVRPDDFDCTIITTYPGSPYFDNAEKRGNIYVYTDSETDDKLYQSPINYLEDLDYYKGNPEDGYVSYVWTDYLTPKCLVDERGKLEAEVRDKLNIPFNPSRPGIEYEHSMGQGNINIPDYILRNSSENL